MSRGRKVAKHEQSYRFWTSECSLIRRLYAELRPHARWFWIILVAAFALRFFGITNASLWMDEIVILQEAFDGQYETVSFRAHAAHLKPAGFWMHVFGQNAFGVRFWSAFLGALAMPLLFAWGVWTWDERLGIAAGLLAAVNCFLIMYAQDGNYYGGMTFYTVVQLIGFTLLFRGAPYSGFFLAAVASLISYKNHPIAAIPSAAILGIMGLGVLLIPSIRRSFFAAKPRQWTGRPALPIAVLCVLAAIPFAVQHLPGLAAFLTRTFEPGETTLKNVEFAFPFFRDHATALLANFHEMNTASYWAASLMAALLAAGFFLGVYTSRRKHSINLAAFLAVALFLPLFSYTILFSISLNRNFNLRYFIYLIPFFAGTIAVGLVSIHEILGRRHFPWIMAAPILIGLCFSGRYLIVDKGNYREGTEYLSTKFQEGERILLPTRNDRIEANYYLELAGLPSVSPETTFLNQPEYADLYAGALPAMLNGVEDIWIVSAWRYVKAPRLYNILQHGLPLEFSGHSKWGRPSDFHLYKWDVGTRVLYPNAAAYFENGGPILAAGAGSWGNESEHAIQTTGPDRLDAAGYFLPNLADELFLRFDEAISPPAHTKTSVIEFEGREYLRNERDDSYDFLLYQDDYPRRLYVDLLRRDEGDPLLARNDRQVPPGFVIAVAVDGRHQSIHEVASGPVEDVRLPIDLHLAPGNHRITISGALPRSVYTPYMPWCFAGIAWDRAKTSPAMLPQLPVVSGWDTMPSAESLDQDWTIQGPYEVAADESIRGPAGDASIRITFPRGTKTPSLLLTPPMDVEPDQICLYSFYYRLEGLNHHELTPLHVFFDAQGRPLPGIQFANGPNIRGTTYGKGWVRRQVVSRVPEGAHYMAGGVQSFPLPEGKTTGGIVWLSSFLSPGIDNVDLADPQLPSSYFGFGQEVLDADE